MSVVSDLVFKGHDSLHWHDSKFFNSVNENQQFFGYLNTLTPLSTPAVVSVRDHFNPNHVYRPDQFLLGPGSCWHGHGSSAPPAMVSSPTEMLII